MASVPQAAAETEEKIVTFHTPGSTSRTPEHSAERIFVDRWSPRGFSEEDISDSVLRSFFEAARWAPSAFNSQPWRFLYTLRGEPEFVTFLAPLIEFNRGWAQHAAALVYLVSKKDFTPPGKTEAQFSRTHSFDSGAAWANFANQAALGGWAAHGMSGFDVDAARKALGVPDGFVVEIAIAVGRKGDGAHLTPALLQREQPSGRSPVSHFVARGLFPERFGHAPRAVSPD
jgi:nitroreductase